MSVNAIRAPYPIYTDIDGSPLENGYIYVGTAGLNPEASPITVYWDSALTVPAAQPVRTSGGYPLYNGSPGKLFSNSSYSIIVKNTNGTLVYSALNETDFVGGVSSSLINFLQAGAGAVLRTLQDKLRDIVSVKDFAATGDGTTDDSSYIQAALDSGARNVFLPKGTYKLGTALSVPRYVSIYGEGGEASILSCLSCNGLNFRSATYDNGATFYENFGIVGHAGSTANWTAVESVLPSGGVSGVDSRDGLTFRNLRIRDFNVALTLANTWETIIEGCRVTKINQFVSMGDYTMVTRIRDNYVIHESGDSFSGTADPWGIVATGPVVEDVLISGNFIYGFERDLHLYSALFIDVKDNDLEASIYGIYISTVSNGLNIEGNYIEVDGAAGVAAIYETALGAEVNSQINIEKNNIIAASTVSCYGIKLGAGGGANVYHNRIVGNLFSGFSAQDIYTDNPGKLVIENNRCLSTGNANSIRIDTVLSKPVIVSNNECTGTITYNAADITSGVLMLRNNMTSAGTLDTTWRAAGAMSVGGVLTFSSTLAGTVRNDYVAAAWNNTDTLTLTTTTLAEYAVYLVTLNYDTDVNAHQHAIYLISRKGTDDDVDAIVALAATTVGINGSDQVYATNNTGTNGALYMSLVRLL